MCFVSYLLISISIEGITYFGSYRIYYLPFGVGMVVVVVVVVVIVVVVVVIVVVVVCLVVVGLAVVVVLFSLHWDSTHKQSPLHQEGLFPWIIEIYSHHHASESEFDCLESAN